MTYLGTRPPLIGEVSEYELHHRARLSMYEQYLLKALYILAVEEKLELLEQFDSIYVTHFSVCRMLEEITHFKNENIEVILSSYNNANVSVEELKQQLLQDTDFIQQIKKSVVVEEDAGKVIEEEQSDGMDMDEGMLMAGLSMFESGF